LSRTLRSPGAGYVPIPEILSVSGIHNTLKAQLSEKSQIKAVEKVTDGVDDDCNLGMKFCVK